MKKRRQSEQKKRKAIINLAATAGLLLLFACFLAGTVLWERSRGDEIVATQPPATVDAPETVPATTEPAQTQPPETTMPMFEPRRINFLLVGRDLHGEGENGRSDSMILCSVDTGERTVTMISFLRDIYLPIPGLGSNRLNAAYSRGGSELLIKTLEENFDISVDVTLEIDFEGFVGLIDKLGGVEITLTREEASHLNSGHGWSLREGANHLDGEQALSYSRIRYLDSDFGRTERHRNVLTALLEKYRTASFGTMLAVTDAFLDESTSDHTDEELLGYALELYTVMEDVELITHRVPADGTYRYKTIRGMSVIDVDFEENITLLRELLG